MKAEITPEIIFLKIKDIYIYKKSFQTFRFPSLLHTHRLICHKEGLATDARALQALVEKADGDIRTCLNTLQFLRSKMSILRHNDVKHLTVGQKDTSKSQYEIW